MDFTPDMSGPPNVRNGGETRGRPKGVRNGEGRTPKHEVQVWKPIHDTIIHLHISTMGNNDIAERLGISAQTVSNTINSSQGRKIIKLAQKRMFERLSDEIETDLLSISSKAVKNIKETIDQEGMDLGLDFKKHQDRLSYDLLKGIGFLPGARDSESGNKSPLSSELSEKLVGALEKANEVALRQMEKEEAREIVVESREAEYEPVGES